MNAELVEKVNRAIAAARFEGDNEARAAIRVVVEECARVLDARYMGDNNREDMEAKRCANAIRALAGKEGE